MSGGASRFALFRLSFLCLLVFYLAPSRAAAGAQQPTPAGLEALLPGVWRGVHISGLTTFHDRIEVRREGSGYVADGLSWCGMTEAQARAALKDKLQPSIFPALNKNLVHPMCIQQEYSVLFKDGQATFKSGVRWKTIRVQSVKVYDEANNRYGPPTPILIKRLERSNGVTIETQSERRGRRRPIGAELDAYASLFASDEPDLFTGPLSAPGIVAQDGAEASAQGFCRLWKEEVMANPLPLKLEKERIVRLTCLDGKSFQYTCYLPKTYDPARPTPLLVNSSPSGNAQPLSPRMADRLGWIMVGLTQSKNGQFGLMAANRDAVLFDLRRRFNIDWKRIYFSGMSGAARGSSLAAVCYPESCAGLLCIGATCLGFTPASSIPIFFLVGETDFNRPEATLVYDREKGAGRKTRLQFHPGGHTWGRPQDHEAALQWLADASAP